MPITISTRVAAETAEQLKARAREEDRTVIAGGLLLRHRCVLYKCDLSRELTRMNANALGGFHATGRSDVAWAARVGESL